MAFILLIAALRSFSLETHCDRSLFPRSVREFREKLGPLDPKNELVISPVRTSPIESEMRGPEIESFGEARVRCRNMQDQYLRSI